MFPDRAHFIFDKGQDFNNSEMPCRSKFPWANLTSLGEFKASFCRDSWGGRPTLHLNVGALPHLFIDSVTDGERVLKPILAADDWPPTLKGLRYFLRDVIRIVHEAEFVREGSRVLLYSPDFAVGSYCSFGGRLLNQERTRLEKNGICSRRDLSFEPHFSGARIQFKPK